MSKDQGGNITKLNAPIPMFTHEKIEERRQELRNTNREKFFELKAMRYALFRVQNFLEGGCMPEAEHMGVANKLEEQVAPYGGIEAFAKRWDLDPLSFKVIQRDRSVWVAHEQYMDRAAVKLEVRGA